MSLHAVVTGTGVCEGSDQSGPLDPGRISRLRVSSATGGSRAGSARSGRHGARGWEGKRILRLGMGMYAQIRALVLESLWSRHFLKTCSARGKGRRSDAILLPISPRVTKRRRVRGRDARRASGAPRRLREVHEHKDHQRAGLSSKTEPRFVQIARSRVVICR